MGAHRMRLWMLSRACVYEVQPGQPGTRAWGAPARQDAGSAYPPGYAERSAPVIQKPRVGSAMCHFFSIRPLNVAICPQFRSSAAIFTLLAQSDRVQLLH